MTALTTIDRSTPDWYKDAVIYQLHIKAFNDSNADGMGDIEGLIRRLDYVAELGVTAIWMLPFYPSPLRDDGYDIADYDNVNPSYGSIEDFKRLVDAAHARGLRVITELVINHTSDQHPWFQRARQAPKGSPERDFYVWSDDDTKWMDKTRIIFNDTETSNWSWDPVAQQFYWHRFYHHQPDLNFDNPAVMDAVFAAMHHWLDMGVDGLRLDAIPYLVERDGTNNENLPETHEILKRIRAEMDAHYPDRMLLAEANQWPEDTRPYFGDGDECQMGFHFPLMPRMYMALAQEDRHPITDILRQTPAIPENCQWAIFLRNHDELTLEMVTDRERDYMWNYYASDRRARINMGIRRRLAPLMGNDRRKIELMNGMLFSMPGTPVVYYGDEIGMGDNHYLNDRDGVRTPMQWSADRNGGFSRANPQQLYLPPIMDPVYGYEAVNVEAQGAQPSSLLNWVKRTMGVRGRHRAFGRGRIDFLYPLNRKVLAYTRTLEEDGTDETILCVFNISRAAQAVELDLSQFKGRVPVELESGNAFPPIGDLSYLLSLPPYGFYWFQLATDAALPTWHSPPPEMLPEFSTLTCRADGWGGVLSSDNVTALQRDVLPAFLPLRRWYADRGRRPATASLGAGPVIDDVVLTLVRVPEGVEEETRDALYFLPLAAVWGDEHLAPGAPHLADTLAKLRRTNRVGALVDAGRMDGFARSLMSAMQTGASHEGGDLTLKAQGSGALRDIDPKAEPRALGVEQSNVSIAFGAEAILKVYRRLRSGVQPDIEVGRFLTEVARFDGTPAYLGHATLGPLKSGQDATVAAAFAFVPNQGDGWSAMLDALDREIEDRALIEAAGPYADTGTGAASDEMSADELAQGEEADAPSAAEADVEAQADGSRWSYPLDLTEVLGRRTAQMHAALAHDTDDPAFGTEPVTGEDVAEWTRATRERADEAFRMMRAHSDERDVGALLRRRDEVDALIDRVAYAEPSGVRHRIHGDYHLGQVLVAQADFQIIDFEGEPRATLDERRAKSHPARDVAGMLRSFDYLAEATLDRRRARGAGGDEAERLAREWREAAAARFLAAYDEGEAGGTEPDLLALFTLQKALYEIAYEAGSRPDWIGIPVRGVLALLDAKTNTEGGTE